MKALDRFNLSTFHACYAKGGPRNQPFHPAMIVKVLLYRYATGVFSSRKLAKRLHEHVTFRVPVLACVRQCVACEVHPEALPAAKATLETPVGHVRGLYHAVYREAAGMTQS